MNNELRHSLRRRWLFSLFEFAHLDFQKNLWLGAVYPDIIGDSTESICQYFNDLNLEEGYDQIIRAGLVTQQEFDIVANFHNKLDNYVKHPDKKMLSDKNILEDNDWIELTNLAKQNWGKIKIIIIDKNELDYMLELEKQYLTNKNGT
ncbi:hypothetical protein EON73_05290 [bacterium]|nr:MAG: hypothetical protein EON73_05290 [bacterium]